MQRVGQTAGDMSDADQALFNQMMQAGTSSSAATPAAVSSLTASTAAPSTSLTPTTLVVGGVLALGLIWFLTRR